MHGRHQAQRMSAMQTEVLMDAFMKPVAPGVINVVTASARSSDGVNAKSRHSENRFHRSTRSENSSPKNSLGTMKRLTLSSGASRPTSSWTTQNLSRRSRCHHACYLNNGRPHSASVDRAGRPPRRSEALPGAVEKSKCDPRTDVTSAHWPAQSIQRCQAYIKL